jgi:CRP-like cAMP-binding protein
MPPPHRDAVLELLGPGATETRPAGTVLFRQGDLLSHLIAVETGIVKLVRSDESGTTTVVGLAAEGALVGLVALELDGKHDVRAECVTSCCVRPIGVEHLGRLRAATPALERALVRSLASDLRRRNRLISLRGVRAPARRLDALRLACPEAFAATRRSDGTTHLVFRIPKTELALICGVAAQTISEMLTTAESAGLLRRTDQGVLLPAPGTRFGAVRPSAAGGRAGGRRPVEPPSNPLQKPSDPASEG